MHLPMSMQLPNPAAYNLLSVTRNSTDLLTVVHNSGGTKTFLLLLCIIVCFSVYTQRLTEMLQVVAGPIIQTLEEEVGINKSTLIKLDQEKKQLLSKLAS